MTTMQRQGSDYGYMTQNHSLPPHMRQDYQPTGPRSTTPLTAAASLSSFTSAPPQQRPPATSHPSSFGPPQPLEPPATGTGSGSASPHMANIGWGSPSHGTLPSPGTMDNYAYPEPNYGGHSLYYPGSSIRRAQSTEPEDYGIRSRHPHGHLANHVPMTADWSAMPLAVHDIKQERYVM